jgi:PAS domain S-box-containing protein
MITSTRTSGNGRIVESRDSTIDSLWRDLNRFALRLGAIAGFAAAVGYLALYGATRYPAFLLAGALGLAVGLSGIYSIRSGATDIELLILTAALAVLSATSIAPAIVRGGLWAALAVLAMIGALLLPDHKQPRFMASMGILMVSQLVWPLVGYATFIDSISNLVISMTSAGAGIAVVRITTNALTRSEQARIELFRSIPVGLFRCTSDGELIDANPALAEMLGYDEPREMIGLQIADLHEDRNDWEVLVRSLDETRGPRRFAHRMLRRHGTALWVRGFTQAVRDPDGTVLYHEGSIEDATQREEAVEISRMHAERFRTVFERAPIAIWEEDFSKAGGRIEQLRASGVEDFAQYLRDHPDEITRLVSLIRFVDVNPAGIALVGAQSKEEAFSAVVPDTTQAAFATGFVAQFVAIWEDRDQFTLEIAGATTEGAITELSMSWAAGRHQDGSLDLSRVVVAIQDIAATKEAERKLGGLVEKKDELIASVSHELRTPITVILGISSELRDNHASFSYDEVAEFVSMIADQSRELSNIVEDLLVAARSEAGTLVIRPELINIEEEIRNILSTAPGAPEVAIAESVAAWADPLRVRQILRNLFSNSERYGGKRVSVEAETLGEITSIRVRDNGIGIPRAERESIFEPYQRSTVDAALPGSLGLGLPVSRSLARLMGGDLTYQHDGSSVFELALPATESDAAYSPSDTGSELESSSAGSVR